jgi:uncharacterized protein YndB with AHSA1/START domain
MKSTATTTVRAPIDAVWSILSDHEGMSNWLPGVSVQITRASTEVPNGVGTLRRFTSRLPMPAIVEEVTEFQPGSRLSYRALSGVPLKNYTGDVVLAPAADGVGTTITYTVSADQRVPLADKAMLRILGTALLAALARQAKKTR